MKKRQKRKASLVLKFFARLLWILTLVITVFFIYKLNKLNMLPSKYTLIIIISMILFVFIIGVIALRKKAGRVLLKFVSFVSLVYIVIFGFGLLKINDTVKFMEKNLGVRFETNIYYVLVNSDSKYENINDIKGEIVYSYKDQDDMSEVEKELIKKVKVDIEYETSIYDLLNNLTSDKELIVYVNAGNYDFMVQNNSEYANKVEILETIEIKTKKDIEKTEVDVTKDPFIILINGIDTRSNSLPSRSLSDVNMLMVINPTTHKILLLGIPRDYYLTIPNTGGAKDKLTHTGVIGGVETTMATLEEAFDIDIAYYARVNFNFVTNLVDAVGGINVYNDESYGFSCWIDTDCYFEPGDNYVDGRCALAFVRERHAYATGDRHRVENQQQVLKVLFNKITSSKTLISNYSNILNSLNGTFETNLTNEEISKLVKMQIDDMPDWVIEQYSLTGYGTSAYTYSYPNQELYVMMPDENIVEEAIGKLKAVLITESDE